MKVAAQPGFEAPGHDPEEPSLVYVLSSMYGYGHSSRAIAVAQALDPPQPISFVARGTHSHDFLRNNLGGYESPLRFVEPDSERPMTNDEYVRQNQHLVEVFARGGVVVNDLHEQIPGLRSLMAQSGVSAPLVGIYHSVTGYQSEDEAIRRFQDGFMGGAQDFDHLFLIEPRPAHDAPYSLDSGTIVTHVDPIVRRPDLTAEEVKAQIGLEPDEEFVYVQGGGQLNGEELETVGRYLYGSDVEGLRAVVSFNATRQTISAGDTIYIKPRPDGHNLVAASAGVISKPGMGTISEAIANRKPLLLVDFPTTEGRTKFEMMREILGDDVPFRLDVAKRIGPQVTEWLEAAHEISSRLSAVPCEGASIVANALKDIQ